MSENQGKPPSNNVLQFPSVPEKAEENTATETTRKQISLTFEHFPGDDESVQQFLLIMNAMEVLKKWLESTGLKEVKVKHLPDEYRKTDAEIIYRFQTDSEKGTQIYDFILYKKDGKIDASKNATAVEVPTVRALPPIQE